MIEIVGKFERKAVSGSKASFDPDAMVVTLRGYPGWRVLPRGAVPAG